MEYELYSKFALIAAGLEAEWRKTKNGRPYLVARYPGARFKYQQERWRVIDLDLYDLMGEIGIVEAFTSSCRRRCIYSL